VAMLQGFFAASVGADAKSLFGPTILIGRRSGARRLRAGQKLGRGKAPRWYGVAAACSRFGLPPLYCFMSMPCRSLPADQPVCPARPGDRADAGPWCGQPCSWPRPPLYAELARSSLA